MRVITLQELLASNDIIEDWPALRARLRRDGYLFIRGLIDAFPTRKHRNVS